MEYYAKSENSQGHQEPGKEHLQKVAALAREYGEVLGLEEPAELEGQIHDFGKYTESFQDVLKGTRTGVDHAMGGACFLECFYITDRFLYHQMRIHELLCCIMNRCQNRHTE